MLSKEQRLTKKKDFDLVLTTGQASYNQTIGVKVQDNQLNHSRFGILVSNKVSKKAVDRNKIKRQIREVIQSQFNRIKPGKDCVVITLPPVLGKRYSEIEKALSKHFKKLHLYKITIN